MLKAPNRCKLSVLNFHVFDTFDGDEARGYFPGSLSHSLGKKIIFFVLRSQASGHCPAYVTALTEYETLPSTKINLFPLLRGKKTIKS